MRQPTMRLRKRGEDGFTLIELLVVIIILGVLSAVVVFAVRGAGDKGQSAAYQTDVKTVKTAEEAFCAKFGRYGNEDELVNPPDGGQGFLSEKSTLTDVELGGGGTCGTSSDKSKYSTRVGLPTAVVNVAANTDQWPTADSATPGYRTSYFAYPLNANVYDPLVIIGSDYSLQPGVATSWESIPTTSDRSTFTSAKNPAALPLPPGHPTYTNAPDRPFNKTTWRFHIRQGVKFHPVPPATVGADLTADDVIWTWRDRQAIMTKQTSDSSLTTVTNTLGYTKNGSPTTAALNAPDAFDSVEKVDQYTVDFTPKTENLRLPEQIAHPKGGIVPVGKHFDGSMGGLPAGPNNGNGGASTTLVPGRPIGSGPFKWESYSPQTGFSGTASFSANESYWGPRAQVKQMNYSFIIDPVARANKVIAGEVDLAIDVDPLSVSAVSAAGKVVTAAYGQNLLLYVNKVVKYGPGGTPKYDLTTDPAVRKAVSLAIDRPTFVSNIFQGQAAPGRWMAPPGILGTHANDVPPLAYDVAQARTVLDGGGWTCGGGAPGANTACGANEYRVKKGGTFDTRSLNLRMIGNDISLSQAGYDLLVAEMKAAGINLTADRLSVADRGTEYTAGDFDLDLELPNQNDANPAFLPTLRFACSRTGTFRFAPVDGTNGVGPAVNVFKPAGSSAADGTWPFGNTPCTSPGNVQGPFDTNYVPAADNATTQDGAQAAAAQQMAILVNQNQTNVVVPITGQFRIYGMRNNVNLGDPHPSQTSQRWISLTKT